MSLNSAPLCSCIMVQSLIKSPHAIFPQDSSLILCTGWTALTEWQPFSTPAWSSSFTWHMPYIVYIIHNTAVKTELLIYFFMPLIYFTAILQHSETRDCRADLQSCMPYCSPPVPVISCHVHVSLFSPILQLLNHVSNLFESANPSLLPLFPNGNNIMTQCLWEQWLRVKPCSAGPTTCMFSADGIFGELAAKL